MAKSKAQSKGSKVVGFRLDAYYLPKLEEYARDHRTGVGRLMSLNDAARELVKESLTRLFPDTEESTKSKKG